MTSWRVALTIALAGFVLWRNLWAGLLCLFPRLMRARSEEESWPRVDRELFARMEEELEPLGFRKLGVHVETPPLKRGTVGYDFAHDGEHTWATGYVHGEDVRLLFTTLFEGGAFVLTGDWKVPSQEVPGACLSGGVPGAEPDHLLATHRRRVERMKEAGRVPVSDLSLDARVRAANAWFAGWGGKQLRAGHVNGLLMSVMGLGILAAALWALWRQA